MKILLLIINSFWIFSSVTAQDKNTDTSHHFTKVYFPEYYNEKGIVFNKDYNIGIKMSDLSYRYTPSKDDIKKAEKVFQAKFNVLRKQSVDTEKYYFHWVRQYLGYITKSGTKNIVVQLIDNSKPRNTNRLLGKNWETDFVILFSDDFYKVSTRIRINLDKEEISENL